MKPERSRPSMGRWLPIALLAWLGACEPQSRQPLPVPPALDQYDPAVQAQHAELATELDRLLATDAEDPELGEAYGRLGMWHQTYRLLDVAELAYRTALELDPEDPRWPYYLAISFERSGKAAEAVPLFESVLHLEPDSVATRVRLGEVLLELGERQRGRELLEQAASGDPLGVRARVSLANAYLEEDRPDTAIDLLEEALGLQPGSSKIRHLLGLAYRGSGQPDRARAHLEMVDSDGKAEFLHMVDPWMRELRDMDVGYSGSFRRGRDALDRGRYRKALQEFQSAIEGNPNIVEGHLGTIRALAKMGRHGEAYEASNRMLDLFPEVAKAHYAHAEVCSVLPERAAEVESSYRRALELDSEFVAAWVGLADLERRRGRLEAAEEHIRRASALSPRDASLLNRWARMLVRLDRRGEAIRALEAGLERPLDQPWGSRLLLEELAGEGE